MSQLFVDAYLPTSTGPTESPVAVNNALERGFDGVFSAETAHDPFLQLAAGITAGPGMTFGTAIAVAFPRSPMTTAMMAWDLQAQSEGQFILGLGTQVRAHIQRRFSTVWDSPGPRLREYVAALHAIWDTWQDGVPLRFKGDFYQFTLMAPFFDPGPLIYDRPKIFMLGLILSFISGIGVTGLAESRDGGIRGTRALARVTRMTPLVTIPYITTHKDTVVKKHNIRIFMLVVVVLVVISFAMVHFFYKPLDLLWFIVLRKLNLA